MLKIPAADVEPSPTEFLEGGLNCVTGLGKYQGRLIVLLDMTKLLEFSTIAGEVAKDKMQSQPARAATNEASRAAASK